MTTAAFTFLVLRIFVFAILLARCLYVIARPLHPGMNGDDMRAVIIRAKEWLLIAVLGLLVQILVIYQPPEQIKPTSVFLTVFYGLVVAQGINSLRVRQS